MSTSEQEIQALKSRISQLEQRVATLEGKRYVPNREPAAAPHSVLDDIPDAVTAPPALPGESIPKSTQQAPLPPAIPANQHGESFLERNVGKYVMGIAASVLVLLSLVGFAQFITPHLTTLAKVIIMYLVSAIFAVVGLLRMWKEGKYKVLFTALAACGVSAVYVTSLVGHFVFDIIGTWALVAILMAWIACLIPLSRRGGRVFAIICNAGIIIASLLCAFNWSSSLAGIAVYVPCIVALYWAVRTMTFKGDWLMLVQLPVVSIALLALGEYRTDTNTAACITSCAVVYAAFLLSQLYYKDDNKQVKLLFLHGITTLAAIMLSTALITVEASVKWNSIICFAALASLLVVLYRKHSAHSPVVFYLLFFPFVICMSTLSYNDTFSQHVGHFAPSAILLMAIGVRFKELPMRLAAVVYVLLWCIFDQPTWEHVIIVTTTALLLLSHTIKHYHYADKYSFTVLLVAGVIMLVQHNMIDITIAYTLLGILGILLCTPLFRNDVATRKSETESVIISYASTFILVGAGVSMLFKPDFSALTIARHTLAGSEPIALGLVILTTTALSIANLKKLYTVTIADERVTSWYNGIKLSIVLFAILHSLHAVNFVISIAGIVLAVLFIIIGFKFLLKGCRLYGLVVSLLCVIKLAMFDIQYDSSIMRPVGLLVSGLLCFGISWIYSRLERKIK